MDIAFNFYRIADEVAMFAASDVTISDNRRYWNPDSTVANNLRQATFLEDGVLRERNSARRRTDRLLARPDMPQSAPAVL